MSGCYALDEERIRTIIREELERAKGATVTVSTEVTLTCPHGVTLPDRDEPVTFAGGFCACCGHPGFSRYCAQCSDA